MRPGRGKTIRGRHLLAIDTVLIAAIFVVAPVVLSRQLAEWPGAIGTAAAVLALVELGTYQHVRSLFAIGEIARLFAATLVAAIVALALFAATGWAATAVPAVGLAAALAFLTLAGYRLVLTTRGWTRKGPADEAVRQEDLRPPTALAAMVQTLTIAPAIYHPSTFWQSLGARHMRVAATSDGLGTFKRTLNTSYFQFGLSTLVSSAYRLMRAWLAHPDMSVWTATTVEPQHLGRPLGVLVALYANAVRMRSRRPTLDRLREPSFGAPIEVRWKSRVITEDLCHSVEEYDAIASHVPSDLRLRRVIELGAGYGRLAWVFGTMRPEVQYFVADIPPALYVSQIYLTSVFPEARAFSFRPFHAYHEVAAEMEQARFVFLEPQQLELLPDRYADLVITISTLHEMRPEQVKHYLEIIDRICGGVFFTKQWKRFYNHADGVTHRQDTYPIPNHWRLLHSGTPIVPGSFFEELYLCHP